jgi:hypothetical protein
MQHVFCPVVFSSLENPQAQYARSYIKYPTVNAAGSEQKERRIISSLWQLPASDLAA